jgi:arsenate reductase
MNRDRKFRCDPASWTKGSHSLIEARATPAVSRAPIIGEIMPERRLRVLFLCTGNAARSQLAEALLRELSKGRADAFSAGSVPAQAIHPAAKAVLKDHFKVDTSTLFPKSMDDFMADRFDFVITVCDKAAERCPVFPGDPQRIHWSFDDPTLEPTAEGQRRACEHVANGLAGRLRIWMSLPEIRKRLDAQPTADG